MSAWLLRSYSYYPYFVNPVVLFPLAEAGDKWALAGVDLPIPAAGSGRAHLTRSRSEPDSAFALT